MNSPVDRVEEQRRARDRHAVAWAEFQHSHARQPDVFFCFFEGYDDPPYYQIRIRGGLSDDVQIRSFICKGKRSATRLHDLITADPKYRLAHFAFFIDSDFDDNRRIAELPNTYLTPGYSVENFYVSEDALRRLVRDSFRLPMRQDVDPDQVIDRIVACYRERLEDFLDAISVLNAWLLVCRRKSVELDMDDMKLAHLVDYRKEPPVIHYTLEKLDSLGQCTSNLYEILDAMHELSQQGRSVSFRGKYLFEFFTYFVLDLARSKFGSCCACLPPGTKNHLAFSDSNPFLSFSVFADTPPCLRSFVEKQNAQRSRSLPSPASLPQPIT
jgi:hypothetical protein